jgi:hypothetical protein
MVLVMSQRQQNSDVRDAAPPLFRAFIIDFISVGWHTIRKKDCCAAIEKELFISLLCKDLLKFKISISWNSGRRASVPAALSVPQERWKVNTLEGDCIFSVRGSVERTRKAPKRLCLFMMLFPSKEQIIGPILGRLLT